MKRSWKTLLSCLLTSASLLSPAALFAQNYLYDTGVTTYGVNYPIPDGFVNVSNGDVHLEIPLASFPQRGSLAPLEIKLEYDSRIWRINDDGGTLSWQPNNVPGFPPSLMAGWRIIVGAGNYSYESTIGCGLEPQYQDFAFVDDHGTSHVFPFTTAENSGCGNTSTASGYATDGSGYYATVSNYTDIKIYDPNGNLIMPTPEDRNGNEITPTTPPSPSGPFTLTDSLGRSPFTITQTSSGYTISVLTVGGATKTYTITTEPINVNTSFQESDVNEFSGSITAIQSIGLPDGSSYSFTYDSGTSSGNYGELTSMTLPVSGSTPAVYIGWSNYFDSYQNVNRWPITVALGASNNATTITPEVITQCTSGGVGCEESVTVIRPDADSDVYTLQLDNGAWDVQADYYDGVVSSANDKLTTATTYNFTNSCNPAICNGAEWVTASTSTTTLDDTGQKAQTVYSFAQPWIGKPSKVQQWDYTTGAFSGTPTRETDYVYGYTVNGAALLTQENTYSNGTALGQVVLNYDQTTPTAISGLPQHVSVSGPRGNLTSIVSGLPGRTQSTVTFAYDDAGMLLSTVDADNHPPTTFAYMCDDAYPSQTTYPTVNSIAHVTKSTEDCNTGNILTSTDENSQVTTYSYDSIGRLSSVTYPDTGTTTYSYPSPTEFVVSKAISSSLSTTTTTTLDNLGRVSEVSQSDPAGNDITKYGYDDDGLLGDVWNPERSGSGSSTDGYTQYTYDFLDRPIQVTDPDGQKITISYAGNQSTVTDEDGNQRRYQYDAFHDLTATWEPDSTGALNWETTYAYDGAGRLTNITQDGSNASAARVRTFVYDSLGRLTSETTPESGTTTFTYDANGNLLTSTDANGTTVTNTYDALNRLIEKQFPSHSYFYSYDTSYVSNCGGQSSANAIGRLTQASNDSNAAEYYAYGPMGRLTLQTNWIPTNGSVTANPVCASYNLAGNLSSLSYPDGRTLGYSYDSADHLTSVQYMGWNGTAENASYLSNTSFDPPGQITAATYGNGITMSAAFTSRQRISALSYAKSGTAIWSKQYIWAANGKNLLQITDEISSAQTHNFTYDPDNRLVSASGGAPVETSPGTPSTGTVTIQGTEESVNPCPPYCPLTYDSGIVSLTVNGISAGSGDFEEGSTSSSIATSLASSINANTSSPVTASTNGNAVYLTSKANGNSSDYSYSTTVTDTSEAQSYFQPPSFSADTSGATMVGGTNPTYQGSTMDETYNIDAWGNLQKSGNYSFVQPFSTDNQIAASGYDYNADGDLLSDGIGNTYQYDGLGQLISSNGATYTYDAVGQRVEKTAGGSSTEYIYFNGQPIALLNPSAGTWTDLIWAESTMFAEVAGTQNAVPNYRLTDHLGSLAVLTDGSGNVIGSNVYTPFGEITSSSTSDPYAFAGLETDRENGSDHATARNLALAQSRWLRPDPYMGSYDLMNPQSFNRYSYVSNMPLEFVDPSGQDGCGVALMAGVEGSGVGVAVGAAFCALEALGTETITKDFWGWIFGKPTFHGSLKPRPSVRTPIWDDNFGVPYQSPLSPGGLGNILDLPSGTGGCDFGVCGNVGFSATSGKSPTVGPTTGAITFSGVLAVIYGVAGPAFSVSWVPTKKTLCIGGGIGVSVGHTLSGGPVVVHARAGKTAKDVFGGWSISGGYNWRPWSGVQGSANTSGGAVGYSLGIPGASGMITYSRCHVFGGG